VIEHLPQELRDRFTEMREMDLQVQSKPFFTGVQAKGVNFFCVILDSADSLEKQVKMFFGRAKKLKQVDRDVEHAGIIKDYYKALEIAGNECAPIITLVLKCFRMQNSTVI
jgi:inhibitor of growth protein 3